MQDWLDLTVHEESELIAIYMQAVDHDFFVAPLTEGHIRVGERIQLPTGQKYSRIIQLTKYEAISLRDKLTKALIRGRFTEGHYDRKPK